MTETEILYQITLPYACAGVIVRDGKAYKTAPIFGWMKGKNIGYIKSWVKKKRGSIERVGKEN